MKSHSGSKAIQRTNRQHISKMMNICRKDKCSRVHTRIVQSVGTHMCLQEVRNEEILTARDTFLFHSLYPSFSFSKLWRMQWFIFRFHKKRLRYEAYKVRLNEGMNSCFLYVVPHAPDFSNTARFYFSILLRKHNHTLGDKQAGFFWNSSAVTEKWHKREQRVPLRPSATRRHHLDSAAQPTGDRWQETVSLF